MLSSNNLTECVNSIAAEPVSFLKSIRSEIAWDELQVALDNCCDDSCDPVVLGALKVIIESVYANGSEQFGNQLIVPLDSSFRESILHLLSSQIRGHDDVAEHHSASSESFVLIATFVLLHDYSIAGGSLWQGGIAVSQLVNVLLRRGFPQQMAAVRFMAWILKQTSLIAELRALCVSGLGLLLTNMTARVLECSIELSREAVIGSAVREDEDDEVLCVSSLDCSGDSTRGWAAAASRVVYGREGIAAALERASVFFEAELDELWPT